MNYKKDNYYTTNDIIKTLKELRLFIRRKWWIGLISVVIGVTIGVVYFYIQKPKYEAVCTFILEEKQAGIGSLGSIASQFGIDIGGMGSGGSIFAGDNILDILKSKKVVSKVLLSPVDKRYPSSLADLYIQFQKLKDKWKEKPELKNLVLNNNTNQLTSIQDSILNIIYDRILKKELIAERVNKKGTIIKVMITSENSVFAKQFTERLVDEASKMYLEIKTGTAQTNINKMQRRSDSLLYLLNRKSFTVAASQPLDINPGIKTASVPVEIATRDKTVLATLYSEVTKNLEASKLILSQQTPIIQILDRPSESMFDNKKTLTYLITISILISLILFITVSVLIFHTKNITKGI